MDFEFKTKDAWLLKDLSYDILECCDELMAEDKDEFNDGQLFAFIHVLRWIQNNVDEETKKYFELDFDIDTKYRR